MQKLHYRNSGGEKMNKNLILIGLCIMLSTGAVQAGCPVTQTSEGTVVKTQQQDYAYSLMDKIRKDRSTIYNALNLRPEQIESTRILEKSRYEELEPLIKEFCIKKKELKTLESTTFTKSQVREIKNEIDCISKQIKKISEQYDRKFEAILDREQSNKYEMIKKLRREDLKRLQRVQEHGAKQSDLRPFGVKISQPTYSKQMHDENCIIEKCKRILRKDKLVQ